MSLRKISLSLSQFPIFFSFSLENVLTANSCFFRSQNSLLAHNSLLSFSLFLSFSLYPVTSSASSLPGIFFYHSLNGDDGLDLISKKSKRADDTHTNMARHSQIVGYCRISKATVYLMRDTRDGKGREREDNREDSGDSVLRDIAGCGLRMVTFLVHGLYTSS